MWRTGLRAEEVEGEILSIVMQDFFFGEDAIVQLERERDAKRELWAVQVLEWKWSHQRHRLRESRRRRRAAVGIQRMLRGFFCRLVAARLRLKRVHGAARRVQSIWRGHLGRARAVLRQQVMALVEAADEVEDARSRILLLLAIAQMLSIPRTRVDPAMAVPATARRARQPASRGRGGAGAAVAAAEVAATTTAVTDASQVAVSVTQVAATHVERVLAMEHAQRDPEHEALAELLRSRIFRCRDSQALTAARADAHAPRLPPPATSSDPPSFLCLTGTPAAALHVVGRIGQPGARILADALHRLCCPFDVRGAFYTLCPGLRSVALNAAAIGPDGALAVAEAIEVHTVRTTRPLCAAS